MRRWYDYITVNIFYLGLSTLSQTNGLLFPILVQKFIGETGKATAYGNLRLWTLMVALLVQSATGMLSDHSSLRWGKRRPFIFTGTLFDLVLITSIGLILGLHNNNVYWLFFTIAIFIQIATNFAQGAQQGLIPDLVAITQRGRFSAVKSLFELPIALLLVSFTTARLIASGNFWGALIVIMIVLSSCMLLTLTVRELPATASIIPLDWQPFVRLLSMTGAFTLVILGVGQAVQSVGHLMERWQPSLSNALIMGMVGITAMLATTGLGVWLCVRIGLGAEAKNNPSFSWWVINRLAYLIGVINLSTFALFYLQARLGYTAEKVARPASILLLLVGVFILLSAVPGGWLADRFGHKRLVAWSGLLATFGIAVALIQPNLALIYLGGIMIGLATGVFYTANWSLGTDLAPIDQAGRYLGISNLAGAGAGAVGAYIGGPIADTTTRMLPDQPGFGYIMLFSIYGVMILFSVLAVSKVKLSFIV
ncbi:MAG: hypothetical protein A2W33_07955 [Chloroflexi bacterium RBG_16_52_11]|nr:MAG: hypothetical protein A2W33_07955 [Chloroflexi bacterium RBG_16_52_11]